jgi:hypothetical protein
LQNRRGISACRRSAGVVSPAIYHAPNGPEVARTARERIKIDGGGYRRDHLRALAQRVEVADRKVRTINRVRTFLKAHLPK